jgi:hypothetical protein
MGPTCAGVSNAGKRFRLQRSIGGSNVFQALDEAPTTVNLFGFSEARQNRVPENLRNFPFDLVELVLTAPAPGSIAERIKSRSRHRQRQEVGQPANLLKQIRRMCIEFRLLFWPGLFMKLEPIPCIPHGENDWKLGENGRVISKAELVSYLSRYGVLSREQIAFSVDVTREE